MGRDDSFEQQSPLLAGAELGDEASKSAGTSDVGTNRDVFKVPAFRRLTLAWVFSNFGDSVLYLTAAI